MLTVPNGCPTALPRSRCDQRSEGPGSLPLPAAMGVCLSLRGKGEGKASKQGQQGVNTTELMVGRQRYGPGVAAENPRAVAPLQVLCRGAG